ncbi:MAG: glycosyltransferase family 4 protein [Candidatus Helarchaeota archaeon]
MRIIFDLRNVGLGNNGGSLTLVKSSNTLVDLGHEVYVVDSVRNQHTWNKLKAKHMIVKDYKKLPDADIIIATGYKSVYPTIKAPERCGIKAHWIRGWETWQMPEDRIVTEILKAPTMKLVNSLCLESKLNKYGISSRILRPGYDLDEIYPLDDIESDHIILGGLYTEGKHVPIKRPDWIYSTFNYLQRKYGNIKLWMFGASKVARRNEIQVYISNPTSNEKLMFYNAVHIWLAPASQEGLHMPPAEAMMAECPVIATDAEMSGTQDYMEHKGNGYVAKNNLDSFIKYTEKLYRNPSTRKEMGKRARKKIEEIGSRETNMKKFVNFISEIIQ